MAQDGMGLDYIWNQSSFCIENQARIDPIAPENAGTD
jgi:hypothetical protein